MTDFKLIGGELPAVSPVGEILQGIGFPLRPVEVTSQAGIVPQYGGIEHFGSDPIGDITSTPQVIPATSASVALPQGVTQDFANNGLIVAEAGVWGLTISVALIFTGVNSARSYQIEFYNATQDTVLVAPIVSVGRNAEGSNPAASLLLDITPAVVGDLVQLRVVSTTDTYTNVSLNFYSFNLNRVDITRTP